MVGLDIGIVIIYFIMLLVIGVLVGRRMKTHEDSTIAGRSLGVFLGGIGKAANSAGGSSSVGGTSWGYSHGISTAWYGLGEGISYIFVAPFIPRLWRAMDRGKFSTVGEYLGYRYGKAAQIFAGALNTLAYTGFVAAQIIATGTIIHVLLGWSYVASALISTVIVIGYTILGGLKAVVYTDVIQMFMIYLGLVFILPPIVFGEVGGIGEMLSKIPDTMKDFGGMGWFTIIGTILIPCCLTPLTMQSTYSYSAACKNDKTALKSFFLVPFLYVPTAVIVILMGMSAFLLFPALKDPVDALPTLIVTYLPHGLVGLLLAAILSATMSTSSTCMLCAVNCLTQDVIKPLRKKEASAAQQLVLVRICIAILGVLTISITLLYTNLISIITLGYAMGVGGLLAPVVATMFWKRATKPAALITMFVGGAIYVTLELTKLISLPPLFISLPVSAILMVVISLFTKADTDKLDIYFDDEWAKSSRNPENAARTKA